MNQKQAEALEVVLFTLIFAVSVGGVVAVATGH